MIINLFGREIYVRKEIIAAIIPLIVIALGFTGVVISSGKNATIIETSEDTAPKKEVLYSAKEKTAPEPTAAQKAVDDEIKVYVTGCVNAPGIVTLKKGQIIDEAIKLAGGATESADLSSINLVYKLKENVMLYIKSREEVKNTAPASVNQQWASAGEAGPGVAIAADSAGAILKSEQGGTAAPGKVNINTASESQLETLPGVGKETAKDIMAYREKNGGFKTIQDIMKVSGIKESRFSKIKDLITVD